MDKLSVQVVINAIDKATATFDKVASGAGNLGDTLSKSFKNATVVSAGLGVAVATIAKKGLESAGEFEQYQIAYTTLLKDQQKAAAAIKQIQEDAAKTPFELGPLVGANQRLISAGISAQQARVDIINLGNAISATGGGNAELERLSTNLQQIKAVGKASALDIKQFAFAGINVYQLLADVTGKNVEQVRDMEISYDLLSQAFQKASESGGAFEGAMDTQSRSLNGLKSTLSDVISLGLKDILVNTGIFESVRSGVEKAIPAIEKLATLITNFVTNNKGAVIVLAGAFSGILAISLIAATTAMLAFIGVSLPVLGIAAAIGAGIALLAANWDNLKGAVTTAGNAIGGAIEWIKTTWQALPGMISSGIETMRQGIIKLFVQDIPYAIGYALGSVVNFVTTIPQKWEELKSNTSTKVGEMAMSVKGWFDRMVNDAVAAVTGLPGKISAAFDTLKRVASQKAKEVYDGAFEWFRKIGDWLDNIYSKATNALNKSTEAFQKGFQQSQGHSLGGGVIPGNGPVPWTVHGGELVLNRSQQNNLFRMLQSGIGGGSGSAPQIHMAQVNIQSPMDLDQVMRGIGFSLRTRGDLG